VSEYLVTKRDECHKCNGGHGKLYRQPKGSHERVLIVCKECDGVGYIDVFIPLMDALKELMPLRFIGVIE